MESFIPSVQTDVTCLSLQCVKLWFKCFTVTLFGTVGRVLVLGALYPRSRSLLKTVWCARTQSVTLCLARVDTLPHVLCAHHVSRSACCARNRFSLELRYAVVLWRNLHSAFSRNSRNLTILLASINRLPAFCCWCCWFGWCAHCTVKF